MLLLTSFLMVDLTYSFAEYYFTPLDGDMSSGVAFNEHIQKVLDDPFGFHMLVLGENHINPNRFFSHFFQKEYMQNVPLWLQNLTDPITSVYLSCAILKIFIHLLLIFILAISISGTRNILKKEFIIAATLIVPLIQANGYWGHMGINDRATTYSIFYALPVVLLMLILLPVYQTVYFQKTVNPGFFKSVFSLIPAIVLPLSGPLVPGIVLIVCLLTFIYYIQNFSVGENISFPEKIKSTFLKTPGRIYIILAPIALVSLYSLLLGRFDSNFNSQQIPVFERYMKLPLGIFYQITQSLGVPLLLLIIGVNVFLIKKYHPTDEGKKIVKSLRWIGLFVLIYLLLLPLGGYRPYRPNILRYDTFIPGTIALIYFYGKSTFFLANKLTGKILKYYVSLLFILFAIYMNSDRIETEKYRFERACLETLGKSPTKITRFPATYNIMSWEPITDPKRSESNAVMLKFWNITNEKKLYYQTSE